MKRIMVPTDFSNCSLEAAKTAVALAKLLKAELHLYSKLFIHEYYDYLTDEEKETLPTVVGNIEIGRRKFDKFKKRLDLDGLKVVTQVSSGKVESEILRYIKENKIDLAVMATHGASGVKEWTVGSVTQKIVRKATCPVLTVKNEIGDVNFKNIVFVSDFDPEVSSALNAFCQLVENFNAKIHFLNIDTPAFFSEIPIIQQELMSDLATSAESQFDIEIELHRIKAWDVEFGIKRFLKEQECDLVVIPTHGKKGFRYLFFNSIAEGVVNHLDFPIMTMKI